MDIYMIAISDELESVADDLRKALRPWVTQHENVLTLIDDQMEGDVSSIKIGVSLVVKKAHDLKLPLNFLFGISKTLKLDFVVGLLKEKEDICYFGSEEGKPDMFEVACYLGVNR